jgi:nicotinamidase-related amidase
MVRLVSVLLPLVLVLAVVATAQTEGAAASDAPELVTALVIIDIQEFYFPDGALPLVEPEAAAAAAGRVLARFRERGDLVIHVHHAAERGMDSAPAVAPREGEIVLVKRQVNAFQDTELLQVLREHQVNQLVLVGMQTHMCLEAATRAAVDLGFACTVIGDACATRDLTHDDRTVAAADVQASTLATLKAYAEVTDSANWLAR